MIRNIFLNYSKLFCEPFGYSYRPLEVSRLHLDNHSVSISSANGLVCILQLENALQVVICKVKANRNIIFENGNNKTH